VSISPRLVDIHCHMLPGIDDGPRDWEESLVMARMAVADGMATVIVTPHQLGNHRDNEGRTIRDRTAHFQQFLDQHGVPLCVLPGADVRIEPDLIQKVRAGEVVTLADRGRYVLLELPHEIYLPLEGLLNNMHRAGLVGILSHPERNAGILREPRLVGPLVEAGCLMQVTSGSLLGHFGPESQKLSEWLLAEGLIHFVATDAHGSTARRPLLRRAFDRVAELAGHQVACDLCCSNPENIVADQPVAAGRHRPNRVGLPRWFRWKRAS